MMLNKLVFGAFGLISLWPTTAYVIQQHEPENYTSYNGASTLLEARDKNDPTDFSWISRWAAIGDSFTAGIGSGKQLGSLVSTDPESRKDWKCSRYSYSWPEIVNHGLGSSVTNFQFKACSGDRTDGIYKQAEDLLGNLDVVMMTAGGNDLCLAAMIKECVFLPWRGEKACQDVIDKAQENINNILKPNIQSVLDKLEDKMKKDSIVVYNGYAPFFNTDNEDCSDTSKQAWAIREWWWVSYWLSSPLPLNIERRKKFNTLVGNINKAIKEVVDSNDGKKRFRIAYSDWSEWPSIVDGQMCSPSGDGHYPDPKQPNLQFFKPDTYNIVAGHDGLKREAPALEEPDPESPQVKRALKQRDDYIAEMKHRYPKNEDLYDSLLYKSRNPRAVAMHKLNPRGTPSAPNCPGDGGPQIPLGLGLPDSFLENFHPNERGHETIAASSFETLVWMRAKILKKDSCAIGDKDVFTCWSKQNNGKNPALAYVSWGRLDTNAKDFCNNIVKQPDNTVNWGKTQPYHENTPEQHEFKIQLTNGAKNFNKQECLDSFDKIINSCDGDSEKNPLNFKHGGRWVRGDYTYEINPKWDRGFLTRMDGECNSHYKFLFSDYDMRGNGWAGWDYGQQTIVPNIKGCLGLGLTKWKFTYCQKREDCGGFDWEASWRTPVFVKARCFGNLKVAKAAGGYTHEYGKEYEKFGCGGSDK